MSLPPDLAAAVRAARLDPDLPPLLLVARLKEAIVARGGEAVVGQGMGAGWTVRLRGAAAGDFHGPTPAHALAACLAWLMERRGELEPEDPG